jgi:hypothetical protein
MAAFMRLRASAGRSAVLGTLVLGVAGVSAAADVPGQSIATISPIYSQLLVVGLPPGFKLVSERNTGTEYTRAYVREGESAESWTQLVTVTGSKGMAHRAGATPLAVAQTIAAGFEKACPASYSGQGLDKRTVSGFEAFMAFASCGTSPTAKGGASESTIMTVIQGQDDIYTVQWAERGPPSATPLPFTVTRWAERLSRLEPLRLCTIVPGEKPPYPSCMVSPRKK